MDLAARMRADILKETECSASVGVASNILLARMATRKAKPNGQFHLQKKDVLDFVGMKATVICDVFLTGPKPVKSERREL